MAVTFEKLQYMVSTYVCYLLLVNWCKK